MLKNRKVINWRIVNQINFRNVFPLSVCPMHDAYKV